MKKERFATLKSLHAWLRMALTFHIPGDAPDIFLFSTPRSGSTWLTELIKTQPGFQWVAEPFDLRRPEVREHLGLETWEALYDPASLPKIAAYLDAFTRGNIRDPRFKYPSLFRGDYRMVTRRRVFKILHGLEDRIEWVRDRYGAETTYLVRHPLPVALSRQEHPRLGSFLHGAYSQHFTQKQIDFGLDLAAKGSRLEKGVLDWCLQNAVPLRTPAVRETMLTYEQLVLEPEPLVARLSAQLRLPEPGRILRKLPRPSGSITLSNPETQKWLKSSEKSADRRWLIEKWKGRISDEEERRLMKIPEMFEIDLYRAGETEPDRAYWVTAQTVQ